MAKSTTANTRNLLQWIELSKSALKKNIQALHKLAKGKALAICVKGNGYGHGLEQIVGQLISMPEVGYLTVHTLEEAASCREIGWTKPIMLLGPFPHNEAAEIIRLDLEPVIFDRQSLSCLGKAADKANVKLRTHLKLETGTQRQGVSEKELPGFAAIYRKQRSLGKPYGASTHFANIEDTTRHDYAESQLQQFRKMIKRMAQLKIKPQICHTASSAALILFEKTHFQLVRPGIGTYGHWPSKETYLSYRLHGGRNDLFRPVLSWKTRITQVKQLPTNSFVGYGCTYRTSAPTRLAVIPVGYHDGYDRGLSNLAYVLVRGKRAPVRGRICMNLSVIDITDIKGTKIGDEVTLVGRDSSEVLDIEQLASWAQTINYEILSRLNPSIPKILTT